MKPIMLQSPPTRQTAIADGAQTLRRLAGDKRGVAGIEFALTFIPFMLVVAFILNVGWMLLNQSLLDNGAVAAGEYLKSALRSADKGHPANPKESEMRQAVCKAISGVMSCDPSRLKIALYPLSNAPGSMPAEVQNTWSFLPMDQELLHVAVLGYEWNSLIPFSFFPRNGGQLHSASQVAPFEIQSPRL